MRRSYLVESKHHLFFLRVLSSLVALALVASPTQSFAQAGIGSANKVVNQVSAALQSKVRKIALKDEVYNNEKISTGLESATEIVFKDETTLTIGPDSDVVLDNFVYKPEPVSGSLALTVSKGVMRFVTGKLSKQAYLVKTPTATIGIRGTIFTVFVAANGATTVTVQAGAVSVTNAVGVAQSISAGQSTSVGPAPAGGSAPPPSPPSTPTPLMQAAVKSMDATFTLAGSAAAAPAAAVAGTAGLTVAGIATAMVGAVVASNNSSNGKSAQTTIGESAEATTDPASPPTEEAGDTHDTADATTDVTDPGVGDTTDTTDDTTDTTFLGEGSGKTFSATDRTNIVDLAEYKFLQAFVTTAPSSTIHPYQAIRADVAYGQGLSGSGQQIAVMDSSYDTDHGDLSGKTITTFGTLLAATTSAFHGTFVAGVAAGSVNGSGAMGVAYGANLHLTDYATSFDVFANAAAGTADATSAIVQNNSWGFDESIDRFNTVKADNPGFTDAEYFSALINDNRGEGLFINVEGSSTSATITSYVEALNDFQEHGVIVYALTNTTSFANADIQAGLPVIFSDLAEAWITVGNTEQTGALHSTTASDYSRKGGPCGDTKEYCLQADGFEITGPALNSGGVDLFLPADGGGSGTSFAAPQVSGAVAILAEAFPNHTPAQLVDRLLASAFNGYFTHEGATTFVNGVEHGFNSEFGHGMVDLSTALSPITTSAFSRSILLGDSAVDALRFNLSSSTARLGPAFGDSVTTSLAGKSAYFYDALYGGFAFDFGSLIGDRAQSVYGLTDRLATNRFGYALSTTDLGSGLSLSTRESGLISGDDATGEDDLKRNRLGFSMQMSGSDRMFATKGLSLSSSLSLMPDSSVYGDNGVSSGMEYALLPFVAPASEGYAMGMETVIGDGVTLAMVGYEGSDETSNSDTTGFITKIAIGANDPGERRTNMFLGHSKEHGAFLRANTDGAFGRKPNAPTNWMGVSVYQPLPQQFEVGGIMTLGSTEVETSGISLINDMSAITSSTGSVYLARKKVLSPKDRVIFSVTQPHHVEAGSANIAVPQLYERGGNLVFDNTKVDLSPSGRQLDFEARYQIAANDNSELSFGAVLTKDYGHVAGAKLAKQAFLTYRLRW